LEDGSMSQSKPFSAAVRRAGDTPRGPRSATTAEGLAAERAVRARRRGDGDTLRVTQAARRLESAARADARCA
jgi:hypothetical protein